MTYFIMTSNGLNKRGSACGVYSEQYAKDCDGEAVASLCAKNPDGVQW